MILNFIIAGRDTTAATLSWFFYMMTCHPEVGDKIVEELSVVTQQPAADHQRTHPGGTPSQSANAHQLMGPEILFFPIKVEVPKLNLPEGHLVFLAEVLQSTQEQVC
jgi:hypothetical protein